MEQLLPNESRHWTFATARGKLIWNHLGERVDLFPVHIVDARKKLSEWWFGLAWEEFFDLFEFTVGLSLSSLRDKAAQFERFNELLEQQGCAYRFVLEELVPLTNPTERAEVEASANSAIPSVSTHIREALSLLPPGKDSSARNSIKESISAVEATLKSLTDDPSATLTEGLRAFEKRYGTMHPALKSGLEKLYGYTSDEKGVRHALVDEVANVSVDDARFMVVTCSAFANYLVALSASPAE